MKKILELNTRIERNGVDFEEVFDGDKEVFSVYDLTQCPEDATISRDLFSASDYLRAVRYGIELAKQGYDEVEYVSI